MQHTHTFIDDYSNIVLSIMDPHNCISQGLYALLKSMIILRIELNYQLMN